MVTANPLGDACDLERQCQPGLTLRVRRLGPVPDRLSPAVTAPRPARPRPVPTPRFAPTWAWALPVSSGEARQAGGPATCLRRCTMDRDCPAGRRCRLVPVAGHVRSLGAGLLLRLPGRDLGAGCRGPSGLTQNELCLGGLCADLGALGMCSLDCTSRPCPTGHGLRRFQRRAAGLSCAPARATCPAGTTPCWPVCRPGDAGPLGFTAAGSPPGRPSVRPSPARLGQRVRARGDLPGRAGRQPLRPQSDVRSAPRLLPPRAAVSYQRSAVSSSAPDLSC